MFDDIYSGYEAAAISLAARKSTSLYSGHGAAGLKFVALAGEARRLRFPVLVERKESV
jgi:hypothetical protein